MTFADTISTSAPQTKALENLSKAAETFQKNYMCTFSLEAFHFFENTF